MKKIILKAQRHTPLFVVMGLVFIVAIGVYVYAINSVEAANTGFVSPTSTRTPNNWHDASDAFSSNNNYADNAANGDEQGYKNFHIPAITAGSTINGIEVLADAKSNDNGGDCKLGIRLSWNNGSSYTSQQSQLLEEGESTKTFGGTSDTWGRTWSVNDFSDANFALKIQAIDPGSGCDDEDDIYVDWVRLQVHYTTPPATINAQKVVCDNESKLPNAGDGVNEDFTNITGSTAADYVEAHDGCELADWSFQWAPDGTANPGDNTGVAGGAWSVPFGWEASVNAPVAKVWLREVWNSDYIPFTGDTGAPWDENSAEFYCSTDVLNYDNYDYIENLQPGQTYYCVGFNALATGTLMVHKQVDTDGDGGYDVTSDAGANALWTPYGWNLNDESPWSSWGSEKVLPTGSYEVTEYEAGDYHFTGWTYSYDQDADVCDSELNSNELPLSVEVNSGETTHITLCNAIDTYYIRAFKWVDPVNDDPYAYDGSDWTWSLDDESGIDNNDGRNVLTNTNHVITETPDVFPASDYTATWECRYGEHEVIGSGEGRSFSTADFETAPTGEQGISCQFLNTEIERYDLTGYKWNDLNGNGLRDCQFTAAIASVNLNVNDAPPLNECEPMLNGWTIFIDENENGLLDGEEQSTITKTLGEQDGWYKFSGLLGGNYRVCEVTQTGWNQTYPTDPICHFTSVPDGEGTCWGDQQPSINQTRVSNLSCNFGNQELPKVAELSIAKSVDKTTANEADTLTYTITVKNTGNGDMNGLQVTDTLPTNTTLVADSFIPPVDVNDGTNFTWNDVSLPAGTEKSFSYQVTVNPSLPIGETKIDNTAVLKCMPVVTGIITDQIQINRCVLEDTNSNLVTTSVVKTATPNSPVLSIVKSVNKPTANPGTTLSYTVTISNSGTGPANNVSMTDVLPNGFTHKDTAGNNTGNATQTWTWPTLANGADVTVKYDVLVNSTAPTGTYINTATTKADNHGEVKATATVTVSIPSVLGVQAPNLTITKSVKEAFVNPSGTLNYTLVVTNTGDSPALNTILTDTLPSGLTFIDGKTTTTWNLGDIVPTEKVTKTYVVYVGADTLPGRYVNTASVKADDVASVTAQATTEVKQVAVLGAEDTILPTTGSSMMTFIYLLGAGLVITFSLYAVKLTIANGEQKG